MPTSYKTLLRNRPRPTDAQMRAFAMFLAQDHSWYKKLPLDGEGEPFFLYLHPNVHAALITTAQGKLAWRDLLRLPDEPLHEMWRLDLEPGDLEPDDAISLANQSNGMSTARYRERLGFWSYWNFGAPDQPRAHALRYAEAQLRVRDDAGTPMPVPRAVLERGLVYLRATVSGDLGPTAEEYESLRTKGDLPAAHDDQAAQLEEMVEAMRRVAAWVYDS